MTTQQDTTTQTPVPHRKDAWRAIVAMLDELPAPQSVRFDDGHPEMLSVYLASHDDLDAWAQHLGARVWSRREQVGDTTQSHAYGVAWRGWQIHLSAVLHVPADKVAEVAAR